MHDVFVYGTLKRGFQNFDAGDMPEATYAGLFRTAEPFPLVTGGPWHTPFMIDEPGNGLRVSGELFAVSDAHLARLDAFESVHLPDGYHRRAIQLEAVADGASRTAWAYLRERSRIDGIHAGPMAEYPLDSSYVLPSDRPQKA